MTNDSPTTRRLDLSCLRDSALIVGVALLLVQGCARSSYHPNSGGGTPALTEDTRRHARNADNPNAPFTLRSRPSQVVAAANPPTGANSVASLNLPLCSPDSLGVVEVAAQVNGDERSVSLAFVNNSEQACKLSGYPTLTLLDDKGAAVGSVSVVQVTSLSEVAKTPAPNVISREASSASSAPIELMLGPKGEAYFGLSWLSGDACPSVSRLIIAAPGLARSFPINHPLKVCSGQVRMTALRPTQNGA